MIGGRMKVEECSPFSAPRGLGATSVGSILDNSNDVTGHVPAHRNNSSSSSHSSMVPMLKGFKKKSDDGGGISKNKGRGSYMSNIDGSNNGSGSSYNGNDNSKKNEYSSNKGGLIKGELFNARDKSYRVRAVSTDSSPLRPSGLGKGNNNNNNNNNSHNSSILAAKKTSKMFLSGSSSLDGNKGKGKNPKKKKKKKITDRIKKKAAQSKSDFIGAFLENSSILIPVASIVLLSAALLVTTNDTVDSRRERMYASTTAMVSQGIHSAVAAYASEAAAIAGIGAGDSFSVHPPPLAAVASYRSTSSSSSSFSYHADENENNNIKGVDSDIDQGDAVGTSADGDVAEEGVKADNDNNRNRKNKMVALSGSDVYPRRLSDAEIEEDAEASLRRVPRSAVTFHASPDVVSVTVCSPVDLSLSAISAGSEYFNRKMFSSAFTYAVPACDVMVRGSRSPNVFEYERHLSVNATHTKVTQFVVDLAAGPEGAGTTSAIRVGDHFELTDAAGMPQAEAPSWIDDVIAETFSAPKDPSESAPDAKRPVLADIVGATKAVLLGSGTAKRGKMIRPAVQVGVISREDGVGTQAARVTVDAGRISDILLSLPLSVSSDLFLATTRTSASDGSGSSRRRVARGGDQRNARKGTPVHRRAWDIDPNDAYAKRRMSKIYNDKNKKNKNKNKNKNGDNSKRNVSRRGSGTFYHGGMNGGAGVNLYSHSGGTIVAATKPPVRFDPLTNQPIAFDVMSYLVDAGVSSETARTLLNTAIPLRHRIKGGALVVEPVVLAQATTLSDQLAADNTKSYPSSTASNVGGSSSSGASGDGADEAVSYWTADTLGAKGGFNGEKVVAGALVMVAHISDADADAASDVTFRASLIIVLGAIFIFILYVALTYIFAQRHKNKRDSEFRFVFDTIEDPLFVVNHKMILIDFNTASEAAFGGRRLVPCSDDGQVASIDAHGVAVLRSGLHIGEVLSKDLVNFVERKIRKDGGDAGAPASHDDKMNTSRDKPLASSRSMRSARSMRSMASMRSGMSKLLGGTDPSGYFVDTYMRSAMRSALANIDGDVVDDDIEEDLDDEAAALVGVAEKADAHGTGNPEQLGDSEEMVHFDVVVNVYTFSDKRKHAAISMRDVTQTRKYYQEVQQKRKQVEEVKRRQGELLGTLMPTHVADAIVKYGTAPVEIHENATIGFFDIVNFTKLSGRIGHERVLKLLSSVFAAFDKIVRERDVRRIDVIGDAYMFASGIGCHKFKKNPNRDPALMCILALDLLEALKAIPEPCPDWGPVQGRIGLGFGPVIAGAIQDEKYSLFGDTVNVAARMESASTPMRLLVCDAVYKKAKDYPGLVFSEPRDIQVKGKGLMTVYFVNKLT